MNILAVILCVVMIAIVVILSTILLTLLCIGIIKEDETVDSKTICQSSHKKWIHFD